MIITGAYPPDLAQNLWYLRHADMYHDSVDAIGGQVVWLSLLIFPLTPLFAT